MLYYWLIYVLSGTSLNTNEKNVMMEYSFKDVQHVLVTSLRVKWRGCVSRFLFQVFRQYFPFEHSRFFAAAELMKQFSLTEWNVFCPLITTIESALGGNLLMASMKRECAYSKDKHL